MARLEWDPSLDTGDDRIDGEHRQLFETFNDLSDAAESGSDSAVKETLETLTDYVLTHFAHEEERMHSTGFAETEMGAHIAEHRHLTNAVRARVISYRTGELTIADLVAFLHNWLQHHVHETDRVLVKHMLANGSEAQ